MKEARNSVEKRFHFGTYLSGWLAADIIWARVPLGCCDVQIQQVLVEELTNTSPNSHQYLDGEVCGVLRWRGYLAATTHLASSGARNYHPHYLTGKHKGFWNWTLHAVGLGMVREGSLSGARLEELVAGMVEADASPTTLVAHCRMHQLIATKPESKA
jgi:hypothetical protein